LLFRTRGVTPVKLHVIESWTVDQLVDALLAFLWYLMEVLLSMAVAKVELINNFFFFLNRLFNLLCTLTDV